METYNQTAFPPIKPFDSETTSVKNAHDTYDVYVNEEYIGKKILLTQTEDIEDIRDYLKVQGVENVATNLEGDHYVIETSEADRVKKIIEVYLQNR